MYTGLDAVEEGRAERGSLQVLEFFKDILGQILLQKRFAVGFLEFLESSFKFVECSRVNHFGSPVTKYILTTVTNTLIIVRETIHTLIKLNLKL